MQIEQVFGSSDIDFDHGLRIEHHPARVRMLHQQIFDAIDKISGIHKQKRGVKTVHDQAGQALFGLRFTHVMQPGSTRIFAQNGVIRP